MRIKIIQRHEPWPGKVWTEGMELSVTNDKAAELIIQKIAREIRYEIETDKDGVKYEVQVEVVDANTTISRKVEPEPEEMEDPGTPSPGFPEEDHQAPPEKAETKRRRKKS
jgi:hypothetical protein